MNKKIHRKKALTAVGAVVAAGLAPGIVGAAPVQGPGSGLTAADVVTIDGNAFGFDELYAMQQPGNGRMLASASPQHATRYGAPNTPTIYYGAPSMPRPSQPSQPYQAPPRVNTEDLSRIQMRLLEYCARQIDADGRGIMISLDSDLTRDLGMNEDQLKVLAAVIKRLYGLEVSYRRFYLTGQLNTLRLVSKCIYNYRTR